jgi:uncharacterized protein YecE (DUF72 family)
MTEFRIGISGWRYEPWRGVFYPKKLAQKRELEYASRQMNSIEINGTFYSLQTPTSFRRWADETPEDFLFAIKGPKYISHRLRLKEARIPLANFFASGVLLLGDKIGPILWQFPPWERFDAERFGAFLDLLPGSTSAAAGLALENTLATKKKEWSVELIKDIPLKYAFEIRHHSFLVPEFIRLLRKHNAAFVLADSAGKWPYTEDITADFLYLRLHGAEEIYASGYTDEQLEWWRSRIVLWTSGREPHDTTKVTTLKSRRAKRVYAYFDNDIKVHAPFDAIKLAGMLTNSK